MHQPRSRRLISQPVSPRRKTEVTATVMSASSNGSGQVGPAAQDMAMTVIHPASGEQGARRQPVKPSRAQASGQVVTLSPCYPSFGGEEHARVEGAARRPHDGMPGCETHQIVQSLMLDCLPRTSNSPTWMRSLGGRRRAWRVESAMRTDCLVVFVIPSMRDAVFTVSP